jgi:hypothetical protein
MIEADFCSAIAAADILFLRSPDILFVPVTGVTNLDAVIRLCVFAMNNNAFESAAICLEHFAATLTLCHIISHFRFGWLEKHIAIPAMTDINVGRCRVIQVGFVVNICAFYGV